jgi:hypothetical protein
MNNKSGRRKRQEIVRSTWKLTEVIRRVNTNGRGTEEKCECVGRIKSKVIVVERRWDNRNKNK